MDIKPGDDWPSRWVAAGGELYEKGTRMIALKGSPVWTALGAGQGGYTDTLGNPFAPFAFGSGYGLRELPRGECLMIGVIDEGDEASAMPSTLKEALKAQAKQVPKDILDAFDDDLEDDGEWLRIAKRKQDAVEAARKLRNRMAWFGEVLMNGRAEGDGQSPLRNRLAALADVLDNSRAYIRDHLGRFAKDGGPLTDDENIQRGERALERALRKERDVPRAMFLPGLGRIDFIWGEPGNPKNEFKPGYGISHIKAKHPRDLGGLVRALVKGRVRRTPNPAKRLVTYTGKDGREWKIIVVKAPRSKDRTPPKPPREKPEPGQPDERLQSTADRRAFFRRHQKRRSRTAWLLSGFSTK
jgi:hypothetical protein